MQHQPNKKGNITILVRSGNRTWVICQRSLMHYLQTTKATECIDSCHAIKLVQRYASKQTKPNLQTACFQHGRFSVIFLHAWVLISGSFFCIYRSKIHCLSVIKKEDVTILVKDTDIAFVLCDSTFHSCIRHKWEMSFRKYFIDHTSCVLVRCRQ